jgi:hypothetical protein
VAGGGYFRVNGVAQGAALTIPVSAAQLAQTVYVGGATVSSEQVWVRAYDGQAWSVWQPWTIANPVNHVPVVTAAPVMVGLNSVTPVASLFTVSDADGEVPALYQFWDDVAGGGYFRVNGVAQGAAQTIPVSAAELAQTVYVGGATVGSEQVWARANDGQAWSVWQPWTIGSDPANVSGNSVANRLVGSSGNNLLNGGAGNDTYLYNRGGGKDTVVDHDATVGNSDTIQFGAGITPLDLMLTRSVNDLKLALHDSTDQVTIQNWYQGADNHVETIQAGDGRQLVNTKVDQLIQAMATLSVSSGLTWGQAIDQRPVEVQAILAASWQ